MRVDDRGGHEDHGDDGPDHGEEDHLLGHLVLHLAAPFPAAGLRDSASGWISLWQSMQFISPDRIASAESACCLDALLGRRRVALHAGAALEGLVEVDGRAALTVRPGAGVLGEVLEEVLHAVLLGGDGTEHLVVGVAGVAAVLAELVVPAVHRREAVRLRVLGVAQVRAHHVAGAAERARQRVLEAGDVAGEGHDEREGAQPEQEHGLGDPVQVGAADDVPDADEDGERRAGERDRLEELLGGVDGEHGCP